MNKILQPEKQGFRDFDLPKEHLLDDRHYVPPKTHDVAEIGRRRDLSPGTLLTERQLRGLKIAQQIIENITEEEGQKFSAHMLAMAGLNTAWYSYAQNSDVMRRRLKLPIMAHPRSRTLGAMREDAVSAFAKQINRANQLVIATDLGLDSRSDHQRRLGVGVGNVSLRLAMFEPVMNGVFESEPDDDEAQRITRRRCLSVLDDARTAHRTMGSHPSIAQLSDPYSHLAVYWYRHAPGSAQSAVVEALAA